MWDDIVYCYNSITSDCETIIAISMIIWKIIYIHLVLEISRNRAASVFSNCRCVRVSLFLIILHQLWDTIKNFPFIASIQAILTLLISVVSSYCREDVNLTFHNSPTIYCLIF